MSKLSIAEICNAAEDNWEILLEKLNIEVPPDYKHGPCPACGGTDRFRFDDLEGRGTWYCNQCDPNAGDGLQLVANVLNCSVGTAAQKLVPLLADLNSPHERSSGIKKQIRCDKLAAEASKTAYAKRLWESCEAASPDNPYLHAKGIGPNGVFESVVEITYGQHKFDLGALVIPRFDGYGFVGVQVIDTEAKRHIGRKKGTFFQLGDFNGEGMLWIAEGFATGATVHELTGDAVLIAFDAGNLLPVAEYARAMWPAAEIAIAADNDHKTDGNPGITKAIEAAKLAGGQYTAPPFENDTDGSDWNDYCQLYQADNTLSALVAGLQAPETVECATAELPEGFQIQNGELVHFQEVIRNGKPAEIKHIVCPEIQVTAITCDSQENNYGRLIEWKTTLGTPKSWAMPMELLAADGAEIRRTLMKEGLGFVSTNQKARTLLIDFIQQSIPQRKLTCTGKTGWHGGAYVLPDTVLGEGADGIILQTTSYMGNDYGQAGTLEDWQRSIGHLCIGNSRLAFAVSCAFAAPLLRLAGFDGGGFHLMGDSSDGKSTVMKVAASVCGGRDYWLTWRSTGNALEGTAARRNDSLLCLDEIHEADARSIGSTVYMLANGQGKGRANRDGEARERKEFRLIFFSTGELSLMDHIESAGERVFAGMEVRLPQIPSNTGIHGAFEELHGNETGANFSDALTDASSRYYGTPFRRFLECLVSRREEAAAFTKRYSAEFQEAMGTTGKSNQVGRVALRFGLVAAAGELAMQFGILPWQEGEARSAAERCFRAWLESRGHSDNRDEHAAIEQVRNFITTRYASDFADLSDTSRNRECVGWKETNGSFTDFYITAAGWKIICRGYDPKQVARLCVEAGLIQPEGNGHIQKRRHIPGLSQKRVYHISSENLEG